MTFKTFATMASTCLVAAFLALSTQPQRAFARTFHCEDVWPQNSTRNSADQCITNATHIGNLMAKDDHVGFIVLMCFAALFPVLAWIGCPIFTIGRYACGCCGSRHRRPGHCCRGGKEWDTASEEEKAAAYSRCGILATKIAALVLLVAGIIFMILVITGASVAHEMYDEVYDQTFDIIDFIDVQQAALRNLLVRNDTGEFILGITVDVFDRINATKETIRGQIMDTKETTDQYVEAFIIASWVISVVPVVLFATTVVCALCHIRRVLPLINLGCHCFWTAPYALFAIVFIIFMVLMGDVCGERNLYLSDPNEPALVSYGVQPVCNRYLPLNDIRSQINSSIVQNAQRACTQMLNICDGNLNFDSSNPQRVYYCEELARVGARNCTSFAKARELIQAAVLKPNNVVECRSNVNDPATAYNIADCNIPACASDCSNEQVRLQAQVIVSATEFTERAEIAYYQFAEPWLYCSVLLTRGLEPLSSCDDLVQGMSSAAAGFFAVTVMLFIGMFVVVFGMKRFFKRPSHLGSPHKREPVHQQPVVVQKV